MRVRKQKGQSVKWWERTHPMFQGKLKGITWRVLHFGEDTAKSVGPCTDSSSESLPVPTSDIYIVYDDVISLWSRPFRSCWGKEQVLCRDPVVLAMRGDALLIPGAEGLHRDRHLPGSEDRDVCQFVWSYLINGTTWFYFCLRTILTQLLISWGCLKHRKFGNLQSKKQNKTKSGVLILMSK